MGGLLLHTEGYASVVKSAAGAAEAELGWWDTGLSSLTATASDVVGKAQTVRNYVVLAPTREAENFLGDSVHHRWLFRVASSKRGEQFCAYLADIPSFAASGEDSREAIANLMRSLHETYLAPRGQASDDYGVLKELVAKGLVARLVSAAEPEARLPTNPATRVERSNPSDASSLAESAARATRLAEESSVAPVDVETYSDIDEHGGPIVIVDLAYHATPAVAAEEYRTFIRAWSRAEPPDVRRRVRVLFTVRSPERVLT